MPSHRKDRSCGDRSREAAAATGGGRCGGVAGKGRAGKRKNHELKANANRYLLNKALQDLEAYMADFRCWYLRSDGPFNEERFARLMDNKKILESLRDNSSRNTSLLVHTVINAVKHSLLECFHAVHSEQSEQALIESISNLRLLHD